MKGSYCIKYFGIIIASAKSYALAVICAVAMLLWISSSNIFNRFDTGFQYIVDLNSRDQFYSQTEKKFQPPIDTINKFTYLVEDYQDNTLFINAIFNVRKPTGEKVISVVRKYAIDGSELTHKPLTKIKARSGYLFGPRGKVDGFTYWHINYDVPFEMKFVGSEKIESIDSLVYAGESIADQTSELTHLSGVPQKYGVNLDTKIKLWIDPRTGWLIKFEDKSKAYYYDQQSKHRLHPWNQFQNVVSSDSVKQNIQNANSRYLIKTFTKVIVPCILLIAFLLSLFGKILFKSSIVTKVIVLRKIPSYRVLSLIVVGLGVTVISGWLLNIPELIQALLFFVPMQFNTALGLFLSGVCLFIAGTSKFQRYLLVFGVIISAIGSLTLVEYVFNVNLLIDELFFDRYIDKKTSHSGRMAPNTAVLFVIVGIYFLANLIKSHTVKQKIEMLTSGLVVSLAFVAFGSYLVGVETAYGWGSLIRMALHTSLGFVVLGLGMYLRCFDQRLSMYDRIIYFLIPLGFLSATLISMSLVQNERVRLIEKIRQAGYERAATIEKGISWRVRALERMAKRWEIKKVRTTEWRDDVENYINDMLFSAIIFFDNVDQGQLVGQKGSDSQEDILKITSDVISKANSSSVTTVTDIFQFPDRRNVFAVVVPTQSESGRLVGIFELTSLLDTVLEYEEPGIPFPVQFLDGDQVIYTQSYSNTNNLFRYYVKQDLRYLPESWKIKVWPAPVVVESSASNIVWLFPLFSMLLLGLLVALLKSSKKISLAKNELETSNNQLGKLNSQLRLRSGELNQSIDELKRSNSDLDDFAYVASHDLKSPLRGIDNLAKWIEEDCGDIISEESRIDLKKMRVRVARMEDLLDGLLQYSRIGRADQDVKQVDLNDIIENLKEILDRPSAFKIEVVGSLPVLQAKVTPLNVVIRNLISNSIKHRNKDDGRVEIRCTDAGGQFYKLSISDNGSGIPEDQFENIFGLFKTIKSRDQVEASGLGLAIVKKIVEQEGGKVTVVNNKDAAGITFVFTWPKMPKQYGGGSVT